MILIKNRTTRKWLSEILRTVVELMAAAGEVLITGRIIKDNDGSRAGKSEPQEA
jgi:hypothetical protein